MMDLLQSLCDAGARYDRFGWLLATAGNLSVRDAQDASSYHISVSGLPKGQLNPRTDFVQMGVGMERLRAGQQRTSAETIVHDQLYQHIASAQSVHHVHAPYVTLLSRAIGADHLWVMQGLEYIKALGFWAPDAVVRVPIVPNYHDIPQLASAAVAAAVRDPMVPCVLVEGHGVYAWGDSVAAAQRHIEAIEFLARVSWEERRI